MNGDFDRRLVLNRLQQIAWKIVVNNLYTYYRAKNISE